MTQEQIPVSDAAEFLYDVQKAVESIAELHGLDITRYDDRDCPVKMWHSDEYDMDGNYGVVEVRVYWKEDT